VIQVQREHLVPRRGGISRLALLGWLALPLAAGAIGALATSRAGAFYSTLTRPAWAPPGWLFGPVWTGLYVLMGVAAWLVWRERESPSTPAGAARRAGLTIFVVQLVANALWSWLFFAWRRGGWAMLDLVLLWMMIVIMAVLFHRVRALAAWLIVPYILWVTYAGALNWVIWRANPALS
jgi:tryptophan-rich sensory protein